MAYEMIGNRYIVSKLIGEGGMADVYLAVDSVLKRQVAIKVLRGELNNDPVNLKRFQREASAITNLSHPNIVEVYDVGEDNHRNYIVMEYVPGKTLKKLIKARGALHPDEAINIMKQLVSATAHAHRNGIIHRDIKSQNVLIKDDGTVKLSDFGIAFTSDSQQLTQTDTVMGSVHYLAPELANGKPVTVQGDIYSLGIVFYEMLTGDVPFHGETAVEIAIKHMHEKIPSVRDFNPSLPQSVENIIIRATAKNTKDRYESADQMYDDLVTCLDLNRMNEPKLIINPPVKKETEQNNGNVVRKKKKKKNEDGSPWTKVFAALGAVILCGSIIAIIMVLTGTIGQNSRKTIMPDLVGRTLDEAKNVLTQYEFVLESIQYEPTDDVEKDVVLRSTPSANTETEAGSGVTLYVSSGKYFVVDNYVGQNINSVKGVLEKAGFSVDVVSSESRDKETGTILSQSVEAGTKYEPYDNKQIQFTVAASPSFIIPTNIIGMDVNEAKKLLEGYGASVVLKQLPVEGNVDPETGKYIHKEGTVVSASPDVGQLYTQSRDNKITLSYY